MQLSVTFRHMEPTDALKAYAKERMERVKKYLPDPIACHVVMSTERHNHRIDVTFQLHNGLTVAGHESTENMYSSIDLCIAKIERQVRKYKGKIEEKRVRPHNIEPMQWQHSIVHEEGEAAAPEASAKQAYTISKTEQLQAKPLSVDDAIVQLNLMNEPFLVFRMENGGAVGVVYTRADGTFGLIDTGGN